MGLNLYLHLHICLIYISFYIYICFSMHICMYLLYDDQLIVFLLYLTYSQLAYQEVLIKCLPIYIYMNCYLLLYILIVIFFLPASLPGQHITLNITSVETECSYDHIYVYDGETYDSPTLGVFSGNTTLPPPVTASSGAMLILLYSDPNYALDGFVAEYYVTGLFCVGCGQCMCMFC